MGRAIAGQLYENVIGLRVAVQESDVGQIPNMGGTGTGVAIRELEAFYIIPEPSTFGLLGLAGLAAWLRRKRRT